MTLLEYLTNLENFLVKNPECENHLVIFSDIKNRKFNPVIYSPSKGKYRNEVFILPSQETNKGYSLYKKAVCIN